MARSPDVTTPDQTVNHSQTALWGGMEGNDAQSRTGNDVKMEAPVWRGSEFVCGYGAAVINVTATFPLNKVSLCVLCDLVS